MNLVVAGFRSSELGDFLGRRRLGKNLRRRKSHSSLHRFIYEGPHIAQRLNRGLAETLIREGFDSLDEAIGCRASEFNL